MGIRLAIILFFLTNCQGEEAKVKVVKNSKKNTIFDTFEDKLSDLGIHYKYYNKVILDPEDRDFAKMRPNRNNLKISKKNAIILGLDSNKVYAGYSFNRLSNGKNMLSVIYNLDIGTYIDFIIYDNQGKIIKKLSSLSSVWDMGFFHTSYAVVRNDTINVHLINKKPITYQYDSKTIFEYTNYIIHFDTNSSLLSDTLGKIRLGESVSNIEKNGQKAIFYSEKKAYKQQILDEEFTTRE